MRDLISKELHICWYSSLPTFSWWSYSLKNVIFHFFPNPPIISSENFKKNKFPWKLTFLRFIASDLFNVCPQRISNLVQHWGKKVHCKNKCSNLSSEPARHKGQIKYSFPMLYCLLFNIFLVFNLSDSSSHANTSNFGQSFEY